MDMETKDADQHAHYYDHNWWGKTAHSMYFQLLPEQGLVGMSIWVYLIVSHFSTLRRLRRDICKDPAAPRVLRRDAELYCGALRGAMVGYLAGGAFVSMGYYPLVWYLTGFTVALDRVLRGDLAAARARRSVARG
jgi:O-antigen ligase